MKKGVTSDEFFVNEAMMGPGGDSPVGSFAPNKEGIIGMPGDDSVSSWEKSFVGILSP